MEEDGDNASFLDGLVSADTRRRTREQTQPLIDLMCSPACIRPTIVTVGSALLILTTLLVAFSITAPTEPVQRQPVTLHAPKWMLDRVTDDIVRVHLKTLSSDLMEGRGPGTRGEDLAADYIASHFTLAGLKPVVRVNETLSFFQSVPLASVTPVTPPPLIIGPLTLEYPSQYTVSSDFFTAEVAVINMDMVFVGYGIVAPAYDWDDYKGVDVKNKIVVMLVNEPYEEDPTHFAGNTLTYYGRWTYKYEQARAKGALGVILIHTTELAGYGWQVVANSFAGEQVMLTDPPVTNPLRYKGWIVEEAADDLAKIHNSSLAEWMTAARSRNFKPIPLSTRFNLTVNYEVRHFTGKNVVGRLGDDKATAEGTVVMSAHHDHLGIRPASGTSADTIYNGAVDNASGVAALLASAYALGSLYLQHEAVVIPGATPVTPVKSILFVTFTGEESNLLGASYFAANSPCDTPVCNASSALNFDIMNVWGPTYDTVAIGYGMSLYMDSLLTEATNAERISLTDDPTPHLGHLFRSDQLPFALAHIPSVTLSAGSHFIANASLAYYNEIMHEYSSKHYHQPSDEYDPTWSMDGVIQQTRVMLRVAYRLSTAKPVPRMDNTEILPPPIETSSETDDEDDD